MLRAFQSFLGRPEAWWRIRSLHRYYSLWKFFVHVCSKYTMETNRNIL